MTVTVCLCVYLIEMTGLYKLICMALNAPLYSSFELSVINSIRMTDCLSVRLFVSVCVSQSVSQWDFLSVCLSVWVFLSCLPVCLIFCLSVCLSVYLSVCLTVWLTVCLSVCLSVCLFVCLSVLLSVCLSVCLSDCLSVCFIFCLSVCLV